MAKAGLRMLLGFLFIVFSQGVEPEIDLLLSMKASIIDRSHSLTTWTNDTSRPFCQWMGITCLDSAHVSKIELPGKNLSGNFPDSVFQLPYVQVIDLSNNQLAGEIVPRNLSLSSVFSSLRYLNLSGNNLTGRVPSPDVFPGLETLDLSNNMLSGEIPGDIGRLSGLKYLDLGGNVLTGRIPDTLTNMTMLKTLTLASNQLTGEIPAKLGLMKELKWIYLGYNNFSGRIPAEIGELTELNHLDLVYNNLTGSIPSSLGNLKNLQHLFLYFNNLSGPIPEPVFNLRNLKSLDLSDNSLSGEIPDEHLSRLENLEILHLFCNLFSGKIPQSVSFLPRLKVLQLWSNKFYGEIPANLGKYNNLTVVDLSTNKLTGRIPESLCYSGQLLKLILFTNFLEGEIPTSLSYCKSLQRVRIQTNRLFGELSPEFTRLPMVYYLDLSSNSFSGRIDDRKWDMPQLQMLNLGRNQFSGSLPYSFGSEKLENLDLSRNKFSGTISTKFGELSELMELRLSGNDLSGRIPDQLSNCKKLVNLDMNHNHLVGEIPTSFAAMPVLGQLDLSVNDLSGIIPPNLGEVQSLVQVNLSYNHFHGRLPSTGAFTAINSTSLVGNHLCGGDKPTGLQPCNRSQTNHIRWFILTVLLAFLAVIVFVAIFIRQRKLRINLKKVESEDGIWELTYLNSRLITIDDILSSTRQENLLPSGRTGLSYKGESSMDKKPFIAKEIASVPSSSWIEWTDYCKIEHPNIVKMLAMCKSEKTGILVHEYVRGKDLSEVISNLNWECRIKVAVGISRALKYLHCNWSPPGIVAGEIRPRKIIVDERNEARLRLSLPGINSSTNFILEGNGSEKPTETSDIYEFGVLLIELLTGKSTTDNIEHGTINRNKNIVEYGRYCYSDCHVEMWIDAAMKNKYGENEVVEVMRVALRCTARDPAARPSAVQVVKDLEGVARTKWFC